MLCCIRGTASPRGGYTSFDDDDDNNNTATNNNTNNNNNGDDDDDDENDEGYQGYGRANNKAIVDENTHVLAPTPSSHSVHYEAETAKTREEEGKGGLLFGLFERHYAPTLMMPLVRPLVILFFLGTLFTSIALIPKVSIGLDQKLSMPRDSYVLDYFDALDKYLSVGVPVYFVVKSGHNYSDVSAQNLLCATSGCNSDSMLNQINQAALQSSYSRLAVAANSWLDDYFDWLTSGQCCLVYKNDTSRFCPTSSSPDLDACTSCPVTLQAKTNRPVVSDFYKYLKFYLSDNPGTKCAKGGHAAYGESVEIINHNSSSPYDIGATFFMAYHTVGVTSTDFIESQKHADAISANITSMLRAYASSRGHTSAEQLDAIEVFPYSISYVFYEQYLTIWRDSAVNLSISISAILVVTVLLLGLDLHTTFIIVGTIVMMLVHNFAAMCLLDIELNAVSLVNLVMAVGISVEFVAHVARDFSVSVHGSRITRAKHTIAHMGSSVRTTFCLLLKMYCIC